MVTHTALDPDALLSPDAPPAEPVVQNGSKESDILFGAPNSRDIIAGNKGNDVIDSGALDDFLLGNAGDDQLIGGSGNDTLYGGRDNDQLFGGTGNDRLNGDRDDDDLYGGTGSDVFAFSKLFGTDVIHDFELVFDTIEFSKKVFKTVADVLSHSTKDASDVLIDAGDGNTIRILNTDLTQLTTSHFMFV